MKTVTRSAAQGDVLFRKIAALPRDAQLLPAKELIVAHSETGHHHVAVVEPNAAVAMFGAPNDAMVSFLRVDRGRHVDIVHKRDFDTHETLRLESQPGDVWEIRRQREWTPEGWRRVED